MAPILAKTMLHFIVPRTVTEGCTQVTFEQTFLYNVAHTLHFSQSKDTFGKRVVKVVQWSYRTKPNYNIPTTLRLRCETCMKIQSITRLIYDDRGPKYFKN